MNLRAANMTMAAKEAQAFFSKADKVACDTEFIVGAVQASMLSNEPKILTLLKWAKAAFIAVCFASFAIIIAALSIIIG